MESYPILLCRVFIDSKFGVDIVAITYFYDNYRARNNKVVSIVNFV